MPTMLTSSPRVWRRVPLLVMGAILAPGQRMISSMLRIRGRAHIRSFQTSHCVLNCAVWSSLGASRILFGRLSAARAPEVEVTFHEVRAHPGLETQRQWSAQVIARATPTLLGLFFLVTLAAHAQMSRATSFVRQAAWYAKQEPTCIDAPALVRRHL
jgi:hypothetical protein